MTDDLRRLLNEWDPIGVADLAADEYDCLINPLLELLRDDAGRREIDEFLLHQVTDHFGLTPVPAETDLIADGLIKWWTASEPAGRTSEP